jgi:hypothetical protein
MHGLDDRDDPEWGKGRLILPPRPDGSEAHPASFPVVLGVMHPEHESNHLPPSSDEVKNS